MKIVLKQEIEKLGKEGDILEVANGYARNFLIPRNMAAVATAKNVKMLEQEKEGEKRKREKEKREIELLAEKIEKISCTLSRQAGEDEKLFGSVTTGHIASALKKEGVEIDKKYIELKTPIKKLGVYTVPLKLSQDVKSKVKVWVVKK